MSQVVDRMTRTPLHENVNGVRVLVRDAHGVSVSTRNYEFSTPRGLVTIQEHSVGHRFSDGGTQKPHFKSAVPMATLCRARAITTCSAPQFLYTTEGLAQDNGPETMTEPISMQKQWWKVLSNSKAVTEPFGNCPPPLVDLAVVQLNVIAPSEVYLNVEPSLFPSNCPRRWQEKTFDRLQLRFLFLQSTNLRISGIPSERRCRLEMDQQFASLRSKDGLFLVSCQFVSARIELYPYRMKGRDAQPLWTFIQ